MVELLVGRVGKPHGVRGEVTVELHTDEPERRFAPGSFLVGGGTAGLTVESARVHQGVWLVKFEEIVDRTDAEAARNTMLYVDADPDARPDDPDEFYDHQLEGLAVVNLAGEHLGTVADVFHGAQDLLVVRRSGGGEGMVPFVKELVPEVDLDAGRVVVADRPGLISPFEDES